jgi:hypothetical protein
VTEFRARRRSIADLDFVCAHVRAKDTARASRVRLLLHWRNQIINRLYAASRISDKGCTCATRPNLCHLGKWSCPHWNIHGARDWVGARPGKLAMPKSIWCFIVGVGCLALMACVSGIANAQQSTLEMHRVGVSADDGSGWHLAVSTKGSFAIRTPIPFNDFTTHDPNTGEMSHGVGCKSSEGIKFAAIESPVTSKTPADLGAITKSFSSSPANKVSDISRGTQDEAAILMFSVTNATSTAHFKYIKTKAALYMLSIESPIAHRDLASATKEQFFGSFKLKSKP